jgi:uncharacterized membrane protein
MATQTNTRFKKLVHILSLATQGEINVGTGERIISGISGVSLALLGWKKISSGGLALAAAGGFLIYRGISGNCPVNSLLGRNTTTKKKDNRDFEIRESLTVNNPREETYAYWRKLDHLPLFMEHLDEVKERDHKRSSWKARTPASIGIIAWEAEITEEEPGNKIVWRSLPGSLIENAGEVLFRDAPRGYGTEISVKITYRAPAGQLESAIEKALNPAFETIIRQDIRGFKEHLESIKHPQKISSAEKNQEKTKGKARVKDRTDLSGQRAGADRKSR